MNSLNDIIRRAKIASTPLMTSILSQTEDESMHGCSDEESLTESHISERESSFGISIKHLGSTPDKSVLEDSAGRIQTYLAVIDNDCVDSMKKYYQNNLDKYIDFLLVFTERFVGVSYYIHYLYNL